MGGSVNSVPPTKRIRIEMKDKPCSVRPSYWEHEFYFELENVSGDFLTKPDPEKQLLFVRPSDGINDSRWMVDQYNGNNKWVSTIPCKSKEDAIREVNNTRARWVYDERKNGR